MQRLLYSIFISFFLILSCAKSKPSGIVSESKITEVLTEVSLVDGYLNTLPSDSAKRVMPVLYDKIFKKYDLDSATFVKNLDFYFGNPNLTDKIYVDVNKNLNNYQREFHVEDSIRNVFVQDSITRVHYIQRVYSRIENLRHFNASDTSFKNYYEFNRRLINNSNVEFISTYLNLSPMPNLNMLHKDSLANYMRNFKSPFVYVDTAKNNTIDITQFKLNSERFTNKLRVYIPSGNYFPTQDPSPPTEIILDRSTAEGESESSAVDTLESNKSKAVNSEKLTPQREMLRNDRMVKPVKRVQPL